MAEFAHVIKLTVEEVEGALLELAFQKAKARGISSDAHTFHAKAAVDLTGTKAPGEALGATIAWSEE